MKLSALALLFVLAAAPGSAADTGSCYAIGDADARIYCLARERRDPSQCYAIQRADLRAQCRAEVSR
jgi:hypothetical protein